MARIGTAEKISMSIVVLLNQFARQASRVSKKFKHKPNYSDSTVFPTRLSLPSTKQILSKASTFRSTKRRNKKENQEAQGEFIHSKRGFGHGGLWQRGILMGEKCEPPDFPGVIHYDHDGNQLSELPQRMPKATPFPGYAVSGKTRDM